MGLYSMMGLGSLLGEDMGDDETFGMGDERGGENELNGDEWRGWREIG
jgi:hypothetical protein